MSKQQSNQAIDIPVTRDQVVMSKEVLEDLDWQGLYVRVYE